VYGIGRLERLEKRIPPAYMEIKIARDVEAPPRHHNGGSH
jgi:hypothetical protein